MTYPRVTRVVVGTMVAVALASAALAQWQRGGYGYGRPRYPPRLRPAGHIDEGFSFCRLMFTSDRRDPSGRGWSTDYPFADINFMTRLSELTSTQVNLADDGEPNHWASTVAGGPPKVPSPSVEAAAAQTSAGSSSRTPPTAR